MSETHYAICRFCHAFCGIKVDVEDGRIAKVLGDKENPMYHGYSCIKGRQLPSQHYIPDRMIRSAKRQDSGDYAPIDNQLAMDEIAEKLQKIIDQHGPRSVAVYTGTFSFMYPASGAAATSFMRAVGSPMQFSSGTIDQPGKQVAMALHGRWNAGAPPFSEANVWMLVGANPIVSKWGGIPPFNPAKRLHDIRKRGAKLIVIDPRRTECADRAEIFLQCKPGEDPTILAGIARVIIDEALFDKAFLDENVEGLEVLRQTVDKFTPEYVEKRAGVPAGQLIEAARLFATNPGGSATAGTGVNMAPRGTLTEYMVLVLNTLCGRWLREDAQVPNPLVLMPEFKGKAQAEPKPPAWGYGEKLRVRNLTNNAAGLSTAALADEILLDGDGQVKALICVGGNPVAAWPDQLKTLEAMKKLELCVVLDIKMTATAKLADYVMAQRLSLEQPGITSPPESLLYFGACNGYPKPYAQYHPAIVEPPKGSNLMEEWEFFYGVAQRLGMALKVNGEFLDMEEKPSTDELFEIMVKGSRIPLSEVKKYPHGHIFTDPSNLVQPKDEGHTEMLDIGNSFMMEELDDVISEPLIKGGGYREGEEFTHRLVSRRMHEVYNSSGRDIPALVHNGLYNPAYMNPADLEALDLAPGDMVRISSDHASILGIVEEAPEVLEGVISMAHAFGDAPEHDAEIRFIGSNTGRLTNVERDFDPHIGMPRMSAIPVNVKAVAEPGAE